MQEELMEIALKRNFMMPSNEIYGHTAGFYDYGVVGAAMKRKIENAWRELFLWREGFYEIESASVLPENVLKASGHVDNFGDPMVQCRKCRTRVRADKLLEDALKKNVEGMKPAEMDALVKENGVKCGKCGGQYGEVVWFNLMFATTIGAGEAEKGYLRPETAQGIFTGFPRIFRALGAKLPLGVGQIGKSFRNEIAPRQALMRLREFTQMELEYFFNSADAKHPRFDEVKEKSVRVRSAEMQKNNETGAHEFSCSELVEKKIVPNEIVAYFMYRTAQFYEAVGLKREKFWFRQLLPNEMPHYSKGNFDVEVETSYGVIELMGLAYRTDFDLAGHAKASSQDLSVHVEGQGRVMPHVVEPSFGVDRLFWAILEQSYRKGGGAEKRDWNWFDFAPIVAPFDACVFPLMKKDGLSEKAEALTQVLRHEGLSIYYDESGSIGKRYARADEVGVPYCITFDYESAEKGTVTIRYRNDGRQERVPIKGLGERIRGLILDGKTSL
ncbi:MAG: glycine--tRNA ligase [Candidatus Burarchaeum sp.]|nr:glycine--tRNA ligase [Candidatus Burarchaeum sp.]MDO8339306.1 glycine--tRNA ligase [Candidatus Burarchaeum sp.]